MQFIPIDIAVVVSIIGLEQQFHFFLCWQRSHANHCNSAAEFFESELVVPVEVTAREQLAIGFMQLSHLLLQRCNFSITFSVRLCCLSGSFLLQEFCIPPCSLDSCMLRGLLPCCVHSTGLLRRVSVLSEILLLYLPSCNLSTLIFCSSLRCSHLQLTLSAAPHQVTGVHAS